MSSLKKNGKSKTNSVFNVNEAGEAHFNVHIRKLLSDAKRRRKETLEQVEALKVLYEKLEIVIDSYQSPSKVRDTVAKLYKVVSLLGEEKVRVTKIALTKLKAFTEIIYDFGSFGSGRYCGELEDKIPHGYGKVWLDSGDLFVGHFLDGYFDGVGFLIQRGGVDCEGGSEYLGCYKRGIKNGFGMKTKYSGYRYTGDWVDDKAHGIGELKYGIGVFVGEVKNHKPHGWGVLTYHGGATHQGVFVDGLPHGYGKHTINNKASEGVYRNGTCSNLIFRRNTHPEYVPPLLINAEVSIEAYHEDVADAMEEYDVETVEDLLVQILDKSIAVREHADGNPKITAEVTSQKYDHELH